MSTVVGKLEECEQMQLEAMHRWIENLATLHTPPIDRTGLSMSLTLSSNVSLFLTISFL
jgi:hypothetical protein